MYNFVFKCLSYQFYFAYFCVNLVLALSGNIMNTHLCNTVIPLGLDDFQVCRFLHLIFV